MARAVRSTVSNFKETLQRVETRMALWRKGCVFFGNDFMDLGARDTVKQVLDYLIADGVIYKIKDNLYCYPMKLPPIVSKDGGVPTLVELAEAIEKRNRLLMKMPQEKTLKKQLID